jgi:uncharacterized membrane protein
MPILSKLLPAFTLVLYLGFSTWAVPATSATLYLITDYPDLAVQPGSTQTIDLVLHNKGNAPAYAALGVDGLPDEWNARILGNGQSVGATMTDAGANTRLQLRLDIPSNLSEKAYQFALWAEAENELARLPITLRVADHATSPLVVESNLRALRGSSHVTFEYPLTIRNESNNDMPVSLSAVIPQYAEAFFTESAGAQQLSSLLVKAGASKDISLTVRMPPSAQPNRYPIKVTVSTTTLSVDTELMLDIVGQPRLRLAGRDGLLSFQAIAGEPQVFPLQVLNDGSAPATDIQFSGSAPFGWRLDIEPGTLSQLNVGEQAEVQLRVTPSASSLVGDYMITARSSAQGQTANSELRVTVNTSSMWGITGLVVIAVALIILAGAIARYGRR